MECRRGWRAIAAVAVIVVGLAACGSSDSDAEGDSSTTVTSGSTPKASATKITLGYSAWPGWFPLAVAEEAGIFDEVGLDVDLKYFADYIGSLDAMSAGQLDGNTQTLNDTMAAVAAGGEQVIVVVNDNSAGNDAIICDESVGNTIADLKDKTIAAEEGVVDHFLLLQGLESVGMTQDNVDFRGALTADAAAAFAGGEFDCVGVFAPFTVQALARPGSHVVFDSADFPGTIPDHIVLSKKFVADHPDEVQKLVDAWYKTLDYLTTNADEATKIMAAKAEVSVEDYEDFAGGTKLFDVDQALEAFKDGDTSKSLIYTANLINPFLVESGLTKEEASLDGLFDASFTQAYKDQAG